MTADDFNRAGVGRLPGYLGVHVLSVKGRELRAELAVRPELMAPNGYLHAGSLITLADTCCGYGCRANLPAGANGFTTIELKSNHLGTTVDGMIDCVATAAHLGKTTQVWDAVVVHRKRAGRSRFSAAPRWSCIPGNRCSLAGTFNVDPPQDRAGR